MAINKLQDFTVTRAAKHFETTIVFHKWSRFFTKCNRAYYFSAFNFIMDRATWLILNIFSSLSADTVSCFILSLLGHGTALENHLNITIYNNNNISLPTKKKYMQNYANSETVVLLLHYIHNIRVETNFAWHYHPLFYRRGFNLRSASCMYSHESWSIVEWSTLSRT